MIYSCAYTYGDATTNYIYIYVCIYIYGAT